MGTFTTTFPIQPQLIASNHIDFLARIVSILSTKVFVVLFSIGTVR